MESGYLLKLDLLDIVESMIPKVVDAIHGNRSPDISLVMVSNETNRTNRTALNVLWETVNRRPNSSSTF